MNLPQVKGEFKYSLNNPDLTIAEFFKGKLKPSDIMKEERKDLTLKSFVDAIQKKYEKTEYKPILNEQLSKPLMTALMNPETKLADLIENTNLKMDRFLKKPNTKMVDALKDE